MQDDTMSNGNKKYIYERPHSPSPNANGRVRASSFTKTDGSRLSSLSLEYKKKYMKQKATPLALEDFEPTEDNTTCTICFKHALDSVLCLNTQCRKLFCLSCKNKVSDSDNKCPFCRAKPFVCMINPHRQNINTLQQICNLCEYKYILLKQEHHYRMECYYFNKINCRFCSTSVVKSQMVNHTKQYHMDRLDDFIMGVYTEIPEHNSRKVIENNKVYLEKIGKSPRLGNTGKFYCGSKLGTKCNCCDGNCGPTNGQNCVDCMKLDLERHGCKKGELVNTEGNICWMEKDVFICGVLNGYYYSQSSCCPENICSSCQRMKTNINRYISLI